MSNFLPIKVPLRVNKILKHQCIYALLKSQIMVKNIEMVEITHVINKTKKSHKCFTIVDRFVITPILYYNMFFAIDALFRIAYTKKTSTMKCFIDLFFHLYCVKICFLVLSLTNQTCHLLHTLVCNDRVRTTKHVTA